MRCFIACFVEGNAVEFASRCPHIDGVRWLPPENLHATLRFLGEIDEAQVGRVNRLIGTLEATTISTTVSSLDGFPRKRRAHVVVARLAAVPLLKTWADKLAETLGAPDKPFVAHVTLGRSRKATSVPNAPALMEFPVKLSAPALYESVLSSSGASYRKVDLGPRQNGFGLLE